MIRLLILFLLILLIFLITIFYFRAKGKSVVRSVLYAASLSLLLVFLIAFSYAIISNRNSTLPLFGPLPNYSANVDTTMHYEPDTLEYYEPVNTTRQQRREATVKQENVRRNDNRAYEEQTMQQEREKRTGRTPFVSHDNLNGQQRIGKLHYTDGKVLTTFDFFRTDGAWRITPPLGDGMSMTYPICVYELAETTATDFVFNKFGLNISYNYANGTSTPVTTKKPLGRQIIVSKDWNCIKYNNRLYTQEVTQQFKDFVAQEQQKFVERAAAQGSVAGSSGAISIQELINESLEQTERELDKIRSKESDIYQKRWEISRGHRTKRYTNPYSQQTVWCDVCRKYDYPHTHPVNDGRH